MLTGGVLQVYFIYAKESRVESRVYGFMVVGTDCECLSGSSAPCFQGVGAKLRPSPLTTLRSLGGGGSDPLALSSLL